MDVNEGWLGTFLLAEAKMFLGQQRNQIFRCIYSKLWSACEVPIPLSKPTAKSKFSEQQCFT